MTPGAAHRIMLVAAFAGLFSAAVLSVAHILDVPVPCGGSSGCAMVASHPSSKFVGVPIAFFGVGFYLVQIVLVGRRAFGQRACLAAVVFAGVGTTISLGLLLYAQFVIHATCPWCVASGSAMVVILVCSTSLLRSRRYRGCVRPALVWSLGCATALAIGVQGGRMERNAALPPIAPELLGTVSPAQLLDPAKSIGPANAAVTITLFADFLCPACRGALASLLEYQNQNPRAVRVVYRHLPLSEISGHSLSKAAAALSEMAAERGKFWAFVDGVHGARKALTRETALELMERLGFNPARVEARLNDEAETAIACVERDIALATQLEISSTPTFIVQVGTRAPVSASQWSLPRLLNSPAIVSLLAGEPRSATRR